MCGVDYKGFGVQQQIKMKKCIPMLVFVYVEFMFRLPFIALWQLCHGSDGGGGGSDGGSHNDTTVQPLGMLHNRQKSMRYANMCSFVKFLQIFAATSEIYEYLWTYIFM